MIYDVRMAMGTWGWGSELIMLRRRGGGEDEGCVVDVG